MTTSLNLYATKVFSEHPLSLWPLDEEAGYLSLRTTDDFNDLSMWDVSGATEIAESEVTSTIPNLPVQEGPMGYLNIFRGTTGNGGLIKFDAGNAMSPLQQSDVNQSMGSIAFGMYVFTPDRAVDVRAGLSYTGPGGQEEILKATRVDPVVSVPARSRKLWAFVSFTFDLPETFSDMNPFFELSYQDTGLDYDVSITGLTLGQWAEEFNSESLGAETSPFPSNIPLTVNTSNLSVVEAKPYGLQGESGYYVVENNKLLSKNRGMPLVFGSSGATSVYPGSEGIPSLILPGGGFLNQAGKNIQSTFEFWTKIQSNSTVERKIFGPLFSEDGMYVSKHLLKFKIGKSSGSYAVGEWDRPMLVSLRKGIDTISVLINGEQVLSMSIEADSFPASDKDWLGFFAYDDIPMVSLECPALYPYEVPSIVQKRRFVYGQGVEYPTSIGGLNHTSIVSFDYSVSNYAKNVSYPKTNTWSSGISENLNADTDSLSLPEYPLPRLYLKEDFDWTEEMQSAFLESDPGFSVDPSGNGSKNGYFYFGNLSFLNQTPQAMFGVFRTTSESTDKEILFKIRNDISAEELLIYLEGGKVNYSLSSLDTPVFYQQDGPEIGVNFVAGLDFVSAQSFGGKVAAFLSTVQSCKIFIAGDPSYTSTFSGNILRVAICSENNLKKFTNVFANNGLATDPSNASSSNMLDQNASYTLVGKKTLGSFGLDIATQSSWEDYAPLSYFAKYVDNANNEKYQALDFLQFNVDYVKIKKFLDGKYDTSSMPVKTYVSFSYLKDSLGADRQNIEGLDASGIVEPGSEWKTTKYEVLNDTIIKFPIGVDKFSLAINFSIEINSDGILTDNVGIRFLEFASQALGNQPNKINTVFGAEVIPYKRSGLYFEYKAVSPFSISKESSPYLHLTGTSGLKPRVPFTNAGLEGVSMPINKNKADFFKIDLFQMSIRYDEPTFPTSPVQLFELQGPNDYIRFYLVADSNTQLRGQVYAIDSNNSTLRSDIVFYVDGVVTKRPILNSRSWTTLSFSFLDSLDFSDSAGALRITSPILFDNVSFYQNSQIDDVQRFSFRQWSAVRSGIDTTFDWQDWQDSTWQEVLFLAESDAILSDAQQIYKTFTGTNSFIFDSSSKLVVNNYRSSVYKDLAWDSLIITPV